VINAEIAENLVRTATMAALESPAGLSDALDALPAPIYVTDRNGCVTHFNRACVDFAGRTPQPGHDRWCVTWKLFTVDGEALAHEDCPMAVAVKEQRRVRGAEALAERPDGSRVRFIPFPTPLFDAHGEFAGAVNLVMDVTDNRRAEDLKAQAVRCRRLASSIGDHQVGATLRAMADEYEAEAELLQVLN
jgi:PAS domain S-box-containing protein